MHTTTSGVIVLCLGTPAYTPTAARHDITLSNWSTPTQGSLLITDDARTLGENGAKTTRKVLG